MGGHPLHPLLPRQLLPREKGRPRSTVRIPWIPSVICMPRNWPRWKSNASVNWKNNVLVVAALLRLTEETCRLPLLEPRLRPEHPGPPRVRTRDSHLMDTCDESLAEPVMYRPENPLLGKNFRKRAPFSWVPLGVMNKQRKKGFPEGLLCH